MNILTGKDRDKALLATLKAQSTNPTVGQWTEAWQERHKAYMVSHRGVDLMPKYVDLGYHREYGEFVEHDSSHAFRHRFSIIDKASRCFAKVDVDTIIELGCGTGINLKMIAENGGMRQMIGTDWESSVVQRMKDLGFKGVCMDMRHPSNAPVHYQHDSVGILTVGSMEFMGNDWLMILDWIRRMRPSVVFHSEPIYELYDQELLFDWVAANYHERRGYLKGYYPQLQHLASKGHIEILELTKMPGSSHHDGSTILVWRPI